MTSCFDVPVEKERKCKKCASRKFCKRRNEYVERDSNMCRMIIYHYIKGMECEMDKVKQ